jgi:hypothetical protein
MHTIKLRALSLEIVAALGGTVLTASQGVLADIVTASWSGVAALLWTNGSIIAKHRPERLLLGHIGRRCHSG